LPEGLIDLSNHPSFLARIPEASFPSGIAPGSKGFLFLLPKKRLEKTKNQVIQKNNSLKYPIANYRHNWSCKILWISRKIVVDKSNRLRQDSTTLNEASSTPGNKARSWKSDCWFSDFFLLEMNRQKKFESFKKKLDKSNKVA